MQQLRENHYESLNFKYENGATESIEEPDKLCQRLEDTKDDDNDTKERLRYIISVRQESVCFL